MDLIGERGLPRWLHFENCVCQNERIGTLRGCMCPVRPLVPPMHFKHGDFYGETWKPPGGGGRGRVGSGGRGLWVAGCMCVCVLSACSRSEMCPHTRSK